ncbi:hypothetical protein K0T92_06055 [Paenibacillus oenotherae]|uniref:Uncharacterized protein n=1 Tax=Paenibacillus oenotherae TaxID=1435645 RepID=A0ABS7D338_9BACL|nr:hypothetical protein [Paenibacillus oenotherae]MBW7474300.1 hypothetical protein [Paenibacillus oenotherae]
MAMEKCSVIYVKYEPSDTIEKQGKRSSIEKYLKQGYYIKESRNGYWVLVKPVQVNIKISNSSGARTFNVKQDILDHYKKNRISEKLTEKFEEDMQKEKIGIYMDEEGDYEIRKEINQNKGGCS